jgi:hypothetical protein
MPGAGLILSGDDPAMIWRNKPHLDLLAAGWTTF